VPRQGYGVGAMLPGVDAFRPDLFRRRRVLVTGGGSGIGRAVAEAFERHGAHVVLVGRDAVRLRDAADEIGGLGMGGCSWHAVDVRDAAAVDAAAAEEADQGGIDVLVNGAAGNFPAPFEAMSPNAWQSVIDIVLAGTVHVTRAFQGQMLRKGRESPVAGAPGTAQPCLLNIVAGYAWTGAPGVSHSGAAKAGVLSLTRSLAVEWAPHVRVNAVSPGPVGGTEGMRRLGDELGLTEALVASVPQGRLGAADEVAQACLFLASPAASFITGHCLAVDGGQDAVGPFGGLWNALSRPAPTP